MRLNQIIPIAVLIAIALPCPTRAQKPAPDPALAAAQLELVRTQIEIERLRADVYRSQIRANEAIASGGPIPPFIKKFLSDPADAVAAFGAIIGFFIAFFVLMGNREANRAHRRDMEFSEAMRRFGDCTTPAGRVGASGVLAVMGGIRERRSYPYLDTAVDQLIAGHRLEENDVVRDAIAGSLKQLILAEPKRVRTKLSAAGIKLPEA